MIQRIQSIYILFILAVVIFLLGANPVMYSIHGADKWSQGESGILEVSIRGIDGYVNGTNTFSRYNSYLIYSLAAVGLLCLLALFMYKNRKSQLLYCGFNYLAMAISGVLMYVYILEGQMNVSVQDSSEMHYIFLVALLMPVFNYMAMRGIMRDEKLIRSMDRLR